MLKSTAQIMKSYAISIIISSITVNMWLPLYPNRKNTAKLSPALAVWWKGRPSAKGTPISVQLLCEIMEIPCIKVTGTAYGGDHIWNAVYLDGKWWMLDVTFNDPVGRQDNNDRWSYFLLDLDTFQQKGTPHL